MRDIDIRPVELHERRAASDAFRAAMLTSPINDEFFESGHDSWDDGDWLAAWDGDRCVANLGAFHFDTTVPGGARLATAGVSRVGVLPTHTRRGLLTQLMQRGLREARERGQVLAGLRASEAPIYGRFGFGLAGDSVAALITRAGARPLGGHRAPGSMRLLMMDEVLDVIPPLYDRVARRRVGTIGRPEWMWKRYLKEATEPSPAPFGKGVFVAVHTDPSSADDGYVHYETEFGDQFATNSAGAGIIREVWGATDAVELALWQYVFDLDLATTWTASARPVDDAIRRALHDIRAYETRRIIDEQWLRILDVDTALRSRTFVPAFAGVNIKVTDPLFADNCGTWRVEFGGAWPIDADFDIAVDIATLSAAYLGGVSWQSLAASGTAGCDVDRHVLITLDTQFAVRPMPFCGSYF